MDFKKLETELNFQARQLLSEWLPGGKVNGHQYQCGSIAGGPGDSFSFNLRTGVWKDFADSEKGGSGLIALYARIHNIENGEAYKRLGGGDDRHSTPRMIHPKYGAPTQTWPYLSPAGNVLCYVARYQTGDAKKNKTYLPWHYNGTQWVCKRPPPPLTLYGLELLFANPKSPVLIVEGEKAADAARKLDQDSVVITWQGGVESINKAEWSPVYGRNITIWPDADKPGREAAAKIANLLHPYCSDIKIINVDDKPNKWDAADALMQKDEYREWKSRAGVSPQFSSNGVNHQTNGNLLTHPIQEEKQIPANLVAVLQYLSESPAYKDSLFFDEFYGRIFIERGGKVETWTDADDIALLVELQHRRKFEKLRAEFATKSVIHHAMQHRRNAPRDWIKGLKWDGKPRIGRFFLDYMGATRAAPGYIYAVSHNFWVSLVARVFQPGCTNYHMVILEGSQGIGKSTALRTIGGPWYSEALESVQSKDFFVTLQGKILIEIGELDSFSRAEVTRIKQVISSTVDNFRSPYGRHSMDHPRTCIFVGTTNDDAYLRDATGALRFWPIPCGAIKSDAIAKDREQLYAEALVCFNDGETWHQTPKEDSLSMQDARRETDALEDVLREKLTFNTPVMINEACAMLGVTADRMDRRFQLRVANALRQLGYTKKQVREGEKVLMKWKKDD